MAGSSSGPDAGPGRPGYRRWVAHRWGLLFMLLPAVAMAVAGLIAPSDAVTDDGAPMKPALLMGAGFWLLTMLVILVVLGSINYRRMMLFEKGLDGRAVILGVEQTGMEVNDMPVLKIRLRVNDGYRGEYETVHKESFPVTTIHRLKVGEEIAVKVDRKKKERLLLLFPGS